MQPQKWQNDSSLFLRQTIQNHSSPSLCPSHWSWSWSWTVLWRPARLSRTNSQQDVLFIIMDWNAKVGNQEIPRVTGKFVLGVQSEAGQRLTENALDMDNILFQQHKRWLYTWMSPNGQYQNRNWLSSLQLKMEKLYTVSKTETWSGLRLRSRTPYCQIQT